MTVALGECNDEQLLAEVARRHLGMIKSSFYLYIIMLFKLLLLWYAMYVDKLKLRINGWITYIHHNHAYITYYIK